MFCLQGCFFLLPHPVALIAFVNPFCRTCSVSRFHTRMEKSYDPENSRLPQMASDSTGRVWLSSTCGRWVNSGTCGSTG